MTNALARVGGVLALTLTLCVLPATAQQEREARPRSPKARALVAVPAQRAVSDLGPAPGTGEPYDPGVDTGPHDLASRFRPTADSNPGLAATLASIRDAGGSPVLAFDQKLLVRAALAARRLRPAAPSRAGEGRMQGRVAAPTTARAAVEAEGAAGNLGAGYIDPVKSLRLPLEMPPVHLPIFVDGSCERDEPGYPLFQAKQAWALAHHNVWRAYQLLEFIGESPGQFRDDYWSDGYRSAEGAKNWSPRHWFGPYAGYRFDAIRRVVRELWEEFQTAETGGVKIRVKCPTKQNEPNNPGNICFTAKPPAHHVVKGYVNLCESFFGQTEDYRALLVAHELLHHRSVTYEKKIWRLRALGDTHLHWHGDACLSSPKTQKMYGPDRILHLASTPGCSHRDINMANNDTYAYFVTRLGMAVRSGALKKFPTEGTPWDTPGGTANECSEMAHPPPGPDIQDPEECFKAGGELICPGGGGGGGGVVLEDACLAMPGGNP